MTQPYRSFFTNNIENESIACYLQLGELYFLDFGIYYIAEKVEELEADLSRLRVQVDVANNRNPKMCIEQIKDNNDLVSIYLYDLYGKRCIQTALSCLLWYFGKKQGLNSILLYICSI